MRNSLFMMISYEIINKIKSVWEGAFFWHEEKQCLQH